MESFFDGLGSSFQGVLGQKSPFGVLEAAPSTKARKALVAGLDWIVQCFTSPPTQYRLYGRRFLQVNFKTRPTVSKYWRRKL